MADIVGEWVDPECESSLIARCRSHWQVPVGQITNDILATFVRQQIALSIVLPEAQRRLAAGYTDDTEQYDDELSVAVNDIYQLPGMPEKHHLK